MFTATFKFDNNFYRQTFSSIEEILQYFYSFTEKSFGCAHFECASKCDSDKRPEAYVCYIGSNGDCQSGTMEEIRYGDTIVFKQLVYISPKTAKIFDDFAEKVKEKEKCTCYGEW